MKWDFYRVALFTALAEVTGALLTVYWIKFNPFECYFFTCESPPSWNNMAMFASFAAGVIIPVSGLVLAFAKLRHSSRSKSLDSLIPNSSPTPSVERIRGRLVYESFAFCFLIAAGVGLYIVHWLYMQFYFVCYTTGPIFPFGVNCSNIFANTLFSEWTIATVAFVTGAAICGSLVKFRKSSWSGPSKELRLSAGTYS
ncbi:MAG: hypothetical protein M1368_07715 [Thaumarchaeota archaeon]|nr:hypothetical protein [Nitrososphaerota archaeon]